MNRPNDDNGDKTTPCKILIVRILFTQGSQVIPTGDNVKLKTFFIFCSFDFEVVPESGWEEIHQHWVKRLI